jgi:hypothetical protein
MTLDKIRQEKLCPEPISLCFAAYMGHVSSTRPNVQDTHPTSGSGAVTVAAVPGQTPQPESFDKTQKGREEKMFSSNVRHDLKILFWSNLFLTIFDTEKYIHYFIQKCHFGIFFRI